VNECDIRHIHIYRSVDYMMSIRKTQREVVVSRNTRSLNIGFNDVNVFVYHLILYNHFEYCMGSVITVRLQMSSRGSKFLAKNNSCATFTQCLFRECSFPISPICDPFSPKLQSKDRC
jgi:hypothetical protein